MIFELIYATLWILLIFFGVRSKYVFKINPTLNKLTGYGFLIKSISILLLLIVFDTIAPDSNLFVDSRVYMKDTAILHDVFKTSPISYFKFLTGIGETNELVLKYLSDTYLWDGGGALYNDSKNVVRYNSLIYFISNGNVYIHVVFMCLFSTIGIRLLVTAFKKHIEAYKLLFVVFLFFMPSLFIASGGVLKEPLLILGLGLFLNTFLTENHSKWKWFGFLAGLLFLISIKPYVFLLVLFGISFFLFSKYILPNKPWLSFSFFILFSSILFFAIQPLKSKTVKYISKKQLDMERIAKGGLYVLDYENGEKMLFFKIEELGNLAIVNDSVQVISPVKAAISQDDPWKDFREVSMEPSSKKWKVDVNFSGKANSFFETTPIRNSTAVLIKSMPEAFVNGLFRPFPNDNGGAFKYPAMLEVWFCMGMFLVSLIYRKKTTLFEKRVLGSLILFFVTSIILIGFTTPVTGALVRYRIPSYMTLVIISFIIFKIPKKWKNQIQ